MSPNRKSCVWMSSTPIKQERKQSLGVIHGAWLWRSLILVHPPITWVSTTQLELFQQSAEKTVYSLIITYYLEKKRELSLSKFSFDCPLFLGT